MAVKKRVNISIDEKTLRLADRAARRRKTSRSEYIRAAVREVAMTHEHGSMEAARRKRQREAVQGMRRLASKAGNWPAVDILHSWRYRLIGKTK